MPGKGQVNSQERKEILLDSTSDMRKNSYENNMLEPINSWTFTECLIFCEKFYISETCIKDPRLFG